MIEASKHSRSVYLDSVAGILLLHMIVAHCCQWAGVWKHYYEYTKVLFFFMPWFFYKAGMFYKKRSLKEEIHKSFHRLIIPFLFFSLIGTVVLWINLAIHSDFSYKDIFRPIKDLLFHGAVAGNLPLWFLLSLFIVRQLFNCVMQLGLSKILRGG